MHRRHYQESITHENNFHPKFSPFMFGIYPYTAVTDKQRSAMEEAGVDYVYQSAYALTLKCLIRLLGDEQNSIKGDDQHG